MNDDVSPAARCGVAALALILGVVAGEVIRAPAASATATTIGPARSEPARGHALYIEKCAMCHDRTGMGTGLLARRVPPEMAELQKRKDLAAGYVELAVRSGVGNMPALSRAEVSDAELVAISDYLRKGRK